MVNSFLEKIKEDGLGRRDPKKLNPIILAYVGDAVYELYVRCKSLVLDTSKVIKMHGFSVEYVNAEAQAKALKAIVDDLTEEEKDIVRRARNRKSLGVPKNVSMMTYKKSTAFEALLGYLFLSGETERLETLILLAFERTE